MVADRLGHMAFRALTSQLRMMPDFIVIGVHRGGTTAFYRHLTEHPNIASATTKEINFFDKNFRKGTLWYRTHFPTLARKRYMEITRGEVLITGEASPHYILHPSVPRRVAQIVPHVKLIALLRNPIDRAYSHYRRYVHLGWENLPFAAICASEEERLHAAIDAGAAIGDDPSDLVGRSSYLARGIYADQVQRWQLLFPQNQLLILRSEDLYANPAQILHRALAFLGMPLNGLPQKTDYDHFDGYAPSAHAPGNQQGEPGMEPALRERLRTFYAPHNHRLYELIGRDMEWE